MQVTREYQQENTTDLSRIKTYDRGRKISAVETMSRNKKRKFNYGKDDFNPKDKTNWKF